MDVPLPPGVPTARYAAPKRVELPNGKVPLIDPNDPESSKVQEHWHVKVRQFVLAKEEDRQALDETFSLIASGKGSYGNSEGQVDARDYQSTWSEAMQSYVVYLRWVEFSYVAPRG